MDLLRFDPIRRDLLGTPVRGGRLKVRDPIRKLYPRYLWRLGKNPLQTIGHALVFGQCRIFRERLDTREHRRAKSTIQRLGAQRRIFQGVVKERTKNGERVVLGASRDRHHLSRDLRDVEQVRKLGARDMLPLMSLCCKAQGTLDTMRRPHGLIVQEAGKMGNMKALILGTALLLAADPTPLFDGKTLTGWTTVAEKPVTAGWEVSEGTIHRATKAMDIVTTKDYDSFDLSFEWKIAPGTNSGLKYHFGKYGEKNIGIEYQLIDTGKPGDSLGKHGVGGVYDLLAPDPKVTPKPAGEWNVSRIVVNKKKITHYLNGKKSVEIVMGSPEWIEALGKSKFKSSADFGTKPGKILLQEHGGEVWFRNLNLTELK